MSGDSREGSPRPGLSANDPESSGLGDSPGAVDERRFAETLDPEVAAVGPEGAPRKVGKRADTPHSVTDRLTLYVARAVFFIVAVGLGLHGAHVMSFLASPNDEVVRFPAYYGVVAACLVAVLLIGVEALFERSPIRTVAAVTFGLLMGLVMSLVFQSVVAVITEALVPREVTPAQLRELRAFLNLMTTAIFCYFGVALLVGTKDDFKFIIPFVEFRKEIKSHLPLILDTSVFIDGRLQSLLAVGAFDQRLEVPRFVLDELQGVADSTDRSLRERGRRGLEILHAIERAHHVDVIDFPLRPSEDVDAGLLRLTVIREGKLVTTDHNLTRRAQVQGTRVVNVNDLAAALKPRFVPGERLRVRLQRPGDEAGQAVGFLSDGTMVVVDDGRDNIGKEVSVEVRSSLQTNAGKMVFAILAPGSRDRSGRSK